MEEQVHVDRVEQQHSFLRETHGMREAVRTARLERGKLLERCEALATKLRKAEVVMERDREYKKEKDEMNSTLSVALNAAKIRNKEVDKIHAEKEWLEHELQEAQDKINQLLLRVDGATCCRWCPHIWPRLC